MRFCKWFSSALLFSFGAAERSVVRNVHLHSSPENCDPEPAPPVPEDEQLQGMAEELQHDEQYTSIFKLYALMFAAPELFFKTMLGLAFIDIGKKKAAKHWKIVSGPSPPASDSRYDPNGFCPLASTEARLKAAEIVGGSTRRVQGIINEANIWIWSMLGDRPVNPSTDPELTNSGPFTFGDLTWAQVRRVAQLAGMIALGKAASDGGPAEGGGRTVWFNNAAWATCWNPAPLNEGPMYFKYSEVSGVLADPGQQRGYFTSTVQSHPDFFRAKFPLFLDGDEHKAIRGLWHETGLARRYPVDVSEARLIPAVPGCKPPVEALVAEHVGALILQSIWGEKPTSDILPSVAFYSQSGKLSIFGLQYHGLLAKVGIAGKIKEARENVTVWAKRTKFGKLLGKARQHFFNEEHPWFWNYDVGTDHDIVDDIATITLFAGVIGTTDMTLKCVTNQKRDESHERLFKENPERYLIEAMRYDSAVTSVTSLIKETTTLNIEGRSIQLVNGTPTQQILASANRDPVHWDRPNEFDPSRGDLDGTLSWNGKVAAVEARRFSEAPRHCPGHCLSLKVGAAVCAAMMGSFEELYAAGKILKDDGVVRCNNFGNHEEAPMWTPPPSDPGDPEETTPPPTDPGNETPTTPPSGSVGPFAEFLKLGDETSLTQRDDVPEHMRGVFWLDQSGSYGDSTMFGTFPDFLITFAEPFDNETRSTDLSVTSNSWTWHNSPEAYKIWRNAAGFAYNFAFDEALTKAQIRPNIKGKIINLPTWLVNFTMTKQTPSADACPPKVNASKLEISKCAEWRRETSFFKSETYTYYVFRIMDEEGNKISPYYEAYAEHVKATRAPDAEAASPILDAGGNQDVEAADWFTGGDSSAMEPSPQNGVAMEDLTEEALVQEIRSMRLPIP